MESRRSRWREGNVNDSWKHKANLQPRRHTLRGRFQGCESTVCNQRHVQAGLPPTPFRSPPTTLGLTFLLKDTTMHSKFSSLSSPSIGDDEMPPLLLTYFKPSFTLSMMWIYQIVDKLIKCVLSVCSILTNTRHSAFTTSTRHPIQFRISESWVLNYFSVDSCWNVDPKQVYVDQNVFPIAHQSY